LERPRLYVDLGTRIDILLRCRHMHQNTKVL